MWSIRRCARLRWLQALPRRSNSSAKGKSNCISMLRLRQSICASAAPINGRTVRRRPPANRHNNNNPRKVTMEPGGLEMASLAEKRVIMSEQETDNVETPDMQERSEELRLIEALLFAAGEPLDER